MLDFFRNFMKSKFGVIFTLAFVGTIAVGFVLGDVGNLGGFGNVGSGEGLAEVGKSKVEVATVSAGVTNALENARQQDPRMSMKAFIAAGGLERVMDQMIDLAALSEFGGTHGIVAGERLVDSEIAANNLFKSADGRFNNKNYQAWLQQNGFTDSSYRAILERELVANQITAPAMLGTAAPRDLVLRYAALLTETRTGAIALIPSAAFAPKTQPTPAEIQAWYTKNRNRFIRPERRVIRFAAFGEEVLKSVPAPTEAEIAKRFNDNQAQYAALETRRFTQVILPTEAAAKAIIDEVAKGKTLQAVASTKGLSAAAIGPLSKQALATQASSAVANAGFAATSGAIAAPARSGLGWHVVRVDAIERRPARSLDQVRPEIVQLLAVEKRRAAINDMSARLEEEFGEGANLADAARELGLTLQSTEPVTADGQVYGKPGQTAPGVLARALQTAFAMERENEPQLAEVEAGKTFLIFDVTRIEASAPASLAEVRADAVTGVMLEKGSAASKAAAEKVLAQARQGTSLSAAMASLGVPLPPVDQITLNRQQLPPPGQPMPPPIRLMFQMAQGTVKLISAPQNRGWYVVSVSKIEPGTIDPADPRLAGVQRDFTQLTAQEYVQQLRTAVRGEVGVTRNETMIKALRTQLGGGN